MTPKGKAAAAAAAAAATSALKAAEEDAAQSEAALAVETATTEEAERGVDPWANVTPETKRRASLAGPLPTPTASPSSRPKSTKRRQSLTGPGPLPTALSPTERARHSLRTDLSAAAGSDLPDRPHSPRARSAASRIEARLPSLRIEAMLPALDRTTYYFDTRTGAGSWSEAHAQQRKPVAVLLSADSWLGVEFGVDLATAAIVVVNVPPADVHGTMGRKADALFVGDILDSVGGRRCFRISEWSASELARELRTESPGIAAVADALCPVDDDSDNCAKKSDSIAGAACAMDPTARARIVLRAVLDAVVAAPLPLALIFSRDIENHRRPGAEKLPLVQLDKEQALSWLYVVGCPRFAHRMQRHSMNGATIEAITSIDALNRFENSFAEKGQLLKQIDSARAAGVALDSIIPLAAARAMAQREREDSYIRAEDADGPSMIGSTRQQHAEGADGSSNEQHAQSMRALVAKKSRRNSLDGALEVLLRDEFRVVGLEAFEQSSSLSSLTAAGPPMTQRRRRRSSLAKLVNGPTSVGQNVGMSLVRPEGTRGRARALVIEGYSAGRPIELAEVAMQRPATDPNSKGAGFTLLFVDAVGVERPLHCYRLDPTMPLTFTARLAECVADYNESLRSLECAGTLWKLRPKAQTRRGSVTHTVRTMTGLLRRTSTTGKEAAAEGAKDLDHAYWTKRDCRMLIAQGTSHRTLVYTDREDKPHIDLFDVCALDAPRTAIHGAEGAFRIEVNGKTYTFAPVLGDDASEVIARALMHYSRTCVQVNLVREGTVQLPAPTRALYDFEAIHEDELSLCKGDIAVAEHLIMRGTKRGGEWWRGTLPPRRGEAEDKARAGIFPVSYAAVDNSPRGVELVASWLGGAWSAPKSERSDAANAEPQRDAPPPPSKAEEEAAELKRELAQMSAEMEAFRGTHERKMDEHASDAAFAELLLLKAFVVEERARRVDILAREVVTMRGDENTAVVSVAAVVRLLMSDAALAEDARTTTERALTGAATLREISRHAIKVGGAGTMLKRRAILEDAVGATVDAHRVLRRRAMRRQANREGVVFGRVDPLAVTHIVVERFSTDESATLGPIVTSKAASDEIRDCLVLLCHALVPCASRKIDAAEEHQAQRMRVLFTERALASIPAVALEEKVVKLFHRKTRRSSSADDVKLAAIKDDLHGMVAASESVEGNTELDDLAINFALGYAMSEATATVVVRAVTQLRDYTIAKSDESTPASESAATLVQVTEVVRAALVALRGDGDQQSAGAISFIDPVDDAAVQKAVAGFGTLALGTGPLGKGNVAVSAKARDGLALVRMLASARGCIGTSASDDGNWSDEFLNLKEIVDLPSDERTSRIAQLTASIRNVCKSADLDTECARAVVEIGLGDTLTAAAAEILVQSAEALSSPNAAAHPKKLALAISNARLALRSLDSETTADAGLAFDGSSEAADEALAQQAVLALKNAPASDLPLRNALALALILAKSGEATVDAAVGQLESLRSLPECDRDERILDVATTLVSMSSSDAALMSDVEGGGGPQTSSTRRTRVKRAGRRRRRKLGAAIMVAPFATTLANTCAALRAVLVDSPESCTRNFVTAAAALRAAVDAKTNGDANAGMLMNHAGGELRAAIDTLPAEARALFPTEGGAMEGKNLAEAAAWALVANNAAVGALLVDGAPSATNNKPRDVLLLLSALASSHASDQSEAAIALQLDHASGWDSTVAQRTLIKGISSAVGAIDGVEGVDVAGDPLSAAVAQLADCAPPAALAMLARATSSLRQLKISQSAATMDDAALDDALASGSAAAEEATAVAHDVCRAIQAMREGDGDSSSAAAVDFIEPIGEDDVRAFCRKAIRLGAERAASAPEGSGAPTSSALDALIVLRLLATAPRSAAEQITYEIETFAAEEKVEHQMHVMEMAEGLREILTFGGSVMNCEDEDEGENEDGGEASSPAAATVPAGGQDASMSAADREEERTKKRRLRRKARRKRRKGVMLRAGCSAMPSPPSWIAPTSAESLETTECLLTVGSVPASSMSSVVFAASKLRRAVDRSRLRVAEGSHPTVVYEGTLAAAKVALRDHRRALRGSDGAIDGRVLRVLVGSSESRDDDDYVDDALARSAVECFAASANRRGGLLLRAEDDAAASTRDALLMFQLIASSSADRDAKRSVDELRSARANAAACDEVASMMAVGDDGGDCAPSKDVVAFAMSSALPEDVLKHVVRAARGLRRLVDDAQASTSESVLDVIFNDTVTAERATAAAHDIARTMDEIPPEVLAAAGIAFRDPLAHHSGARAFVGDVVSMFGSGSDSVTSFTTGIGCDALDALKLLHILSTSPQAAPEEIAAFITRAVGDDATPAEKEAASVLASQRLIAMTARGASAGARRARHLVDRHAGVAAHVAPTPAADVTTTMEVSRAVIVESLDVDALAGVAAAAIALRTAVQRSRVRVSEGAQSAFANGTLVDAATEAAAAAEAALLKLPPKQRVLFVGPAAGGVDLASVALAAAESFDANSEPVGALLSTDGASCSAQFDTQRDALLLLHGFATCRAEGRVTDAVQAVCLLKMKHIDALVIDVEEMAEKAGVTQDETIARAAMGRAVAEFEPSTLGAVVRAARAIRGMVEKSQYGVSDGGPIDASMTAEAEKAFLGACVALRKNDPPPGFDWVDPEGGAMGGAGECVRSASQIFMTDDGVHAGAVPVKKSGGGDESSAAQARDALVLLRLMCRRPQPSGAPSSDKPPPPPSSAAGKKGKQGAAADVSAAAAPAGASAEQVVYAMEQMRELAPAELNAKLNAFKVGLGTVVAALPASSPPSTAAERGVGGEEAALVGIPDDADPWTHTDEFERAHLARRRDRRRRLARKRQGDPAAVAAANAIAAAVTQSALRAVVAGTLPSDALVRLTLAAASLRAAVTNAKSPFGQAPLRRKALAACGDAHTALLALPVAIRNSVVDSSETSVGASFAFAAAQAFKTCSSTSIGVGLGGVAFEDSMRDVLLLVHLFGSARASTPAFAAAAALEELKEFVKSHPPAEAEEQIATIASSIETFVDGVDRLSGGADAKTKEKALALVRLVLSDRVPMAALLQPLQDSLALREIVDEAYGAGERGVRGVMGRDSNNNDAVLIMREARVGADALPEDPALPRRSLTDVAEASTPEGEAHDARRMADIFLEIAVLLDDSGSPPDHSAGGNVRDCFLLLLVLSTQPTKAHRFRVTRDRKTNVVVAVAKKTFESDDAPWAPHYEKRCFPDNDAWHELLRSHRETETKWTDPDFPPDESSLGPSPATAAAGCVELNLPPGVRWSRLSERFAGTKWIQLNFVDVDGRLGAGAGKCFGADPNLMNESPEPSRELPDVPSGGVSKTQLAVAIATTIPKTAAAIVEGTMQSTSVEEYCGDPQVAAYLLENLPQIIASNGLEFVGVGRVNVVFNGEKDIGQPRLEAHVELKFNAPVHMFSGATQGVIAQGNVTQGLLGDGYFLQALGILSTQKQLLFDILPPLPADEGAQSFNAEGIYAVRFWRGGEWRIVVVDDWVPETKEGNLIFARPPGRHAEIWAIIAEKAYAKLNGSFAAIAGGTYEDALEDICQCVPLGFDLGVGLGRCGPYAVATKDEARSCFEALWAYLSSLRHAEVSLLGVAWRSKDSVGGAPPQKRGTYGNHAYGVVSLHDDVAGTRIVRLRNPHGDVFGDTAHGWDGAWCDADPRWNNIDDDVKASVGRRSDGADDGTFFMAFDDFVEHWDSMSVARLLGNRHSNPYIAHLNPGWSEWTVSGELFADGAMLSSSSADGAAAEQHSISKRCRHADQFQIVVKEACELVVSLSIHSRRMYGDPDFYRALGGSLLPICSNAKFGKPIREGRRVDGIYDGSTLGDGKLAPHAKRTHAVVHQIEAGCYNIVPLAGNYRGRYTLRVFTSGGVPAELLALGAGMSEAEMARRAANKMRRQTRRASRIAAGLAPVARRPSAAGQARRASMSSSRRASLSVRRKSSVASLGADAAAAVEAASAAKGSALTAPSEPLAAVVGDDSDEDLADDSDSDSDDSDFTEDDEQPAEVEERGEASASPAASAGATAAPDDSDKGPVDDDEGDGEDDGEDDSDDDDDAKPAPEAVAEALGPPPAPTAAVIPVLPAPEEAAQALPVLAAQTLPTAGKDDGDDDSDGNGDAKPAPEVAEALPGPPPESAAAVIPVPLPAPEEAVEAIPDVAAPTLPAAEEDDGEDDSDDDGDAKSAPEAVAEALPGPPPAPAAAVISVPLPAPEEAVEAIPDVAAPTLPAAEEAPPPPPKKKKKKKKAPPPGAEFGSSPPGKS